MIKHSKQNWFNTLNDALEAEGLLHTWECTWPPIEYGHTKFWTYDDGSKYGYFISIHRDSITGKYERPVHYKR